MVRLVSILPGGAMSSERIVDEKTAIFQNSWRIYETILDRNFMFHNELFAEVREFLVARFPNPFTVADLGCGSARHIAQALKGLPVKHYRGIDVSGQALAHAHEHLTAAGIPFSLDEEDLFKWVMRDKTPHHFLFSAFALHHLNLEQKKQFFIGARQSIAPKGAFLLIDIIMEEDETRPVYLDRYCNWVQAEWNGFSQEDLVPVVKHVRDNDYPQKVAEYNRMAVDSGFAPVRELCRFGWHRALLFEGC